MDLNSIIQRLLKVEDKNVTKIFLGIIIFFITGIVLLGALKFAELRTNKLMRADIYSLSKINDSIVYYNRTAQKLPGNMLRNNAFKQSGEAILELVANDHISFEDIYLPSLLRSLFFRNCGEKDISVCVGLSQIKARVTTMNVNVWPLNDMLDTSAFPAKYACFVERHLDNGIDPVSKTVNKDAYKTGRGYSLLQKPFLNNCEQQSAKPDLNGSFDYIFRVGDF